jgi:hypothetical protein
MNYWNLADLHVDKWGVTPISLVAPVALLMTMLVVRRFARAAGPRTGTADFASAALIFIIIAAAFLWVFAGLGFLARIFH